MSRCMNIVRNMEEKTRWRNIILSITGRTRGIGACPLSPSSTMVHYHKAKFSWEPKLPQILQKPLLMRANHHALSLTDTTPGKIHFRDGWSSQNISLTAFPGGYPHGNLLGTNRQENACTCVQPYLVMPPPSITWFCITLSKTPRLHISHVIDRYFRNLKRNSCLNPNLLGHILLIRGLPQNPTSSACLE